jgi:hypothetical protein
LRATCHYLCKDAFRYLVCVTRLSCLSRGATRTMQKIFFVLLFVCNLLRAACLVRLDDIRI